MSKFGHLVKPDEKVMEAVYMSFVANGVVDREKARELWEYAQNQGWIPQQGITGSIQDCIDAVCRRAKYAGILYKFQ